MAAFEKIVTSEGHLTDSGQMRQIFDAIISDGGEFQILDFEIGKTNHETFVRLDGGWNTVEYLITLFLFRWPDPCVMTGRCLKLSPI